MNYNQEISTTTSFDNFGVETGYTVKVTSSGSFEFLVLLFNFILGALVIYWLAKRNRYDSSR